MFRSERKGRKLLSSYLFTYLAVLLIPVIAAFICYGEAAGMIRTDIENENRVLLQQASDILDVRMQELSAFGAQMVSNAAAISLRYVENPLEYPNIQQYFRIQSTLPVHTPRGSFLFDYFLFFNRGQLAMNDRYVYSYEDFYHLYMRSPGQTLEEWKQETMNLPLSSNSCSVRSVEYLNADPPREMNLIELTFSFLPYENHDGQIVLYVDQQKLTDLINTFQLGQEEMACIESAEGVVLASSAQSAQAEEALRDYLGAQQPVDLARARINGRDMLISRYRSGQTGLSIAIARSSDRVYARLNSIRWVIAVSLLAAVLLGIAFSFLFSWRNSGFLRKLAFGSAAESLSGMSYGKAFQSLRKSFEDIRIANDTMEQALANQQPYLQKSFLTQLLNGDFATEENALAIAGNIPSFHPDAPMRVVLLHFSGDSAFSGDAMDLQMSVNCKAVIRLAIESLEPDALRMSRSENDYVLLLSGERLEERIEALVHLIRTNLPEDVSECLFVCVGNAVEKLTDVVRSGDNASSMIFVQPSPADVSVQYFQESQEKRMDVFYPPDMQRRLANSVMNADEQGALEILDQLKEKNRQGTGMPAYIAQLLIDSLLSTLLQINTMSGLPKEKTENILNSVKSMMVLPTTAQLDMINTLYSSLCGAVRQLKGEGGKQQIMEEISAYIKQHYMEADLSLTGVANRFHISESYLSFTFKEQTGINFFSFVEDLRISKAKTLLRQTNLKINEIAQQSGYASANSFCRAFKRNTGESASNYRNGTEENDA